MRESYENIFPPQWKECLMSFSHRRVIPMRHQPNVAIGPKSAIISYSIFAIDNQNAAQCRFDGGPASATLAQPWSGTGQADPLDRSVSEQQISKRKINQKRGSE